MNIFSEIYGTYFRIAAKLLENEVIDEKTVRETVLRDGFRDSILFLPQKLIPSGEDWGLFKRDNNNMLRRITKKAPEKVLTKLQKMWLKSKLSDPRIRLFLEDNTITELEAELADIKPLYRHEHFRLTDRYADHDDYSDEKYIANFHEALDAVKKRKIVDISFTSGHGKHVSGRFVMLKIEFSPKNGKFRAYCYKLSNDKIKNSGLINIGRIDKITDTGRIFRTPVSMDNYFSSRKCSTPAVIRVTNERNGVERFMLEFAPYAKHTVRDLEKNEYVVELWYDEQDETEVLIMLLSFGPVIEILGPEKLRSQAKERLDRQYELLYGKNAQ